MSDDKRGTKFCKLHAIDYLDNCVYCSEKPMIKYYIPTLNGEPCFFDGDQMCYAGNPSAARCHNLLVKDLKTVRKQQSLSAKHRLKRFEEVESGHDYILVYAPR